MCITLDKLQGTDYYITSLAILGEFLGQFPAYDRADAPSLKPLNDLHYEEFRKALEEEPVFNPWFTPAFLEIALKGISLMLKKEILEKWLEPYGNLPVGQGRQKTVGLVMAGNIPLVGFHDVMCVLAAGHNILARTSSRDDRLIRRVAGVLSDIDPELGHRITITDQQLRALDAVIATGSDNSARYFEYYFRNIPHIIRKNRNGVAVLTGRETTDELAGLGEDIFTYFGMGCRNVTKIFVPGEYDLTGLLKVFDRYADLYRHHRYGNNVDYYRTIYLMNRIPILDNGVLLLKEDRSIASPVGVVFYERYSDIDVLRKELEERVDEIQCIVSLHPAIPDAIRPGTTQVPMPWDYADGIDTLMFLKDLH